MHNVVNREFTEEELALYKRSSERVQRFILLFWHGNSFDTWIEARRAIHAAGIYAEGKDEELLDEWYALANKRIDGEIGKRAKRNG